MDILKWIVLVILVLFFMALIAAPVLHFKFDWRWSSALIPLGLWFVVFVILAALFVWIISKADFG